MEPGILLLIVFIVAPLIEKLLKAAKQQTPPDQERMPPRQPQQHVPAPRSGDAGPVQWEQESEPQVVLRRSEGDEAAAAMLPDDLWEILTGEKRVPQHGAPQQRAPTPQPEPISEAYSEEESLETDDFGWVSEPLEVETISSEDYERPLPVRTPPVIVSMEDVNIDGRLRHQQFHTRIDSLGKAAHVRIRPANAYRITGEEDLRKAIVMAEVLGPPKGLQ